MKNLLKIKLRQDSRDAHAFMKFGQIFDFNTPVNFDDPNIPEKVQPLGDIKCVLYTGTYIAQNTTKKEYDIDELFSRVPHYPTGTDVREVFGEIVKNGLNIKGTNLFDKPFSSYWRADTGNLDAFDNARSASLLAASPIAIASYWYLEWLNLRHGAVMPIGKTPVSGHMYAEKGWQFADINGVTIVNGKPMFIIEWWGGFTTLMPRETFNEAMKVLGVGAWVLSTSDIDAKRIKTLTETVHDLLVNAIIVAKQFLNILLKKQTELPRPPVDTTYEEVKEAIKVLKYSWDTDENIRHSIRVIGDEHGLSVLQKDLACDIASCESGDSKRKFNIDIRGRIDPRDRGLFQWNSTYHPEITDEIAFDPEQNTRLAVKAIKVGRAHSYWSASEHCWNQKHKYDSII